MYTCYVFKLIYCTASISDKAYSTLSYTLVDGINTAVWIFIIPCCIL